MNTLHKNNKYLTIAIPSYNASKWLANCVESILTKSSKDGFDILIINDGSTDNTHNVALNLQNRFPECIRIINKSNGGWGSAVKEAIILAKGKYFKVIDADDSVYPEGINNLLDLTKTCTADIIANAYTEHVDSCITQIFKHKTEITKKSISIDSYIKKSKKSFNITLGSLTYKTSILKETCNYISDRYYSDIEYIWNFSNSARSIYLSNELIYKYNKGIADQSTSINGYKKNKHNFYELCIRMCDFYLKNIKKKDIYGKLYLKNCLNCIGFLYELYLSPIYANSEEQNIVLKSFENELKSMSKKIYFWSLLKFRRGKPAIFFFRIFGINIYNFRKWI